MGCTAKRCYHPMVNLWNVVATQMFLDPVRYSTKFILSALLGDPSMQDICSVCRGIYTTHYADVLSREDVFIKSLVTDVDQYSEAKSCGGDEVTGYWRNLDSEMASG